MPTVSVQYESVPTGINETTVICMGVYVGTVRYETRPTWETDTVAMRRVQVDRPCLAECEAFVSRGVSCVGQVERRLVATAADMLAMPIGVPHENYGGRADLTVTRTLGSTFSVVCQTLAAHEASVADAISIVGRIVGQKEV